MEKLTVVIDGSCNADEQIEMLIERNTRGWRLFPQEPKGAEWDFCTPFWGYTWDGTVENLIEVITKGTKVGDKNKQHLLIFRYDGEDLFVWCSWTREFYDCTTKVKHQLVAPKLGKQMVDLINQHF